MTRIIMHGCNGHMGRVITDLVSKDDDIEIVAGIDPFDDGHNTYPVFASIKDCDVKADAVIDFASAKAEDALLDYCVEKQIPVVVCTTGLSKEQLDKEFLTDMSNIERIYGTYPVGMAYAYGCVDDEVVKYLKSIGIKYGRTVEASHSFEIPKEPLKLKATCHHDDDMLFELAEKFLKAEPKENEQMLFYVWGHSYEFDVNNNWDRIEEFCKMMSGKADIFYGTNRECLVG